MRSVAIALAAAVLMTACGSRSESGASASATVSPTSGASATLRATAGPIAFPLDLPFIVGTNAGDLFFQIDKDGRPTGRSVHGCGTPITHISTSGRMALFNCSGPDSALYLYDDTTSRVTRIDKTEVAMSAFDADRGFAYVTIGATVATAPISMTKLLYRDLKTGATAVLDERFAVARDLRSSGEGIAIWRPRNNDSFMRSDAEAGTWLVHGGTLTKLSQHRLVDASAGRYLLETEGVDTYGYTTSNTANTFVVLRTSVEQQLTPPGIQSEKALAILDNGRLLAWRPEGGIFDGTVIVYDAATKAVVRQDRGKLSASGVLRSGDWIVGSEYSGVPSLTLRAYRSSDGMFAALEGAAISAWAFLGPK